VVKKFLAKFAPMVTRTLYLNEAGMSPFESGTHRLCVEIGSSAVLAVLWNRDARRAVAVERFAGISNPDDWYHLVQQSILLGYKQLQTEVILNFERAAPLPAPVYTPELARQHLTLLFAEPMVPHHTGADLLANEQMAMAWQLPLAWYQTLSVHFSMVRFCHLAGLLVAVSAKQPLTSGTLVVFDHYAWVALFHQDALLYCRAVAFQRPEDLIYHLLNACQQFRLNATTTRWQVAGLTVASSMLWEGLAKYFEAVLPWVPPFETSANPLPAEQPTELLGHYFSHIFWHCYENY
jgi:hypothetical protein